MSTEFHEGDKLTFARGTSRIVAKVRPGSVSVCFESLPGSADLKWMTDMGWVVAWVEKAAPKLPTEPGSVLRGTGPNRSILMRRYPVNGHEPEGPWVSIGDVTYSDDEAVRFFHGQFTPLEPVQAIASRVLDAIDASFTPGCDRIFTYGAARRIARKFGVE